MSRVADWTIRLPKPVDVMVGKKRKTLRTLDDVADFLLDDLPDETRELKQWHLVAGKVDAAAQGLAQPGDVSAVLFLAMQLTRGTKPWP